MCVLVLVFGLICGVGGSSCGRFLWFFLLVCVAWVLLDFMLGEMVILFGAIWGYSRFVWLGMNVDCL